MDAKNMKTALTIAGSDSSGGAGIQADIKTMITNGVYAMSAITALTAQNTTGVSGIFDVTPEFLAAQLDAVFTDIFPDAVKIGMVSSPALIEVISERLRFYQAKHIVVDPVLVATSGSALASGGVPDLMKKLLFPLAEGLPEQSFKRSIWRKWQKKAGTHLAPVIKRNGGTGKENRKSGISGKYFKRAFREACRM